MGGSSRSSSSRSSSRGSLHLKVLFGALALVGVIFLFTASSQQGGRTEINAPTVTSESGGNSKLHAYIMGRGNFVDHPPELDLNYMSKRRVPNGPDPIHNRRTGNSGRPPGRA
ncbi:uncharacterized protein LOC121254074 [Juglans microcarpa x Juglans regia]|uniref:uncharacterized protein LOC121254074 n=1 Tax=Juglans microcarpa x Juglans regia TaxID=2249226 RepID=UPI001B7F2C73|nr:uncharacterized protein LOC121254074 [Juglans microcarpa x Juglans regia]